MNQMSIKSKCINRISLGLILSMAVCAGCKKEPVIVPNTAPPVSNDVIKKTKQVSNVDYMERRLERQGSGKDGKGTNTTADQAGSRISTPENDLWLSKLLTLNPDAKPFFNGTTINVHNPVDVPLKLPNGPIPNDVTLTDNP